MNSDCAFRIGKTHPVCQDYAVARSGDGAAFVLLADGCSGSPDTDIGARLLVKSSERILIGSPAEPKDGSAYHAKAVENAAACAERLGLPPTCLDATLLTIWARDGAWTASCSGDGVVALGRQDGRLEIFVVSFAASYPRYLSYRLNDARMSQWQAQPGNEKRIQRVVVGPEGVELEETSVSERDLETWTGDRAEYRFAAVLSDGVQSFAAVQETETSRVTRPVAAVDILPDLLAFKGSRGQFVQRRVQAFFKDCETRHRHHSDDFSLGVVWLEE